MPSAEGRAHGLWVQEEKAWVSYLWFTRVDGERPYLKILGQALNEQELELIERIALKEVEMLNEISKMRSSNRQKSVKMFKELHAILPGRIAGLLGVAVEQAREDWLRMRARARITFPQNIALVYATQYHGDTALEAALPDKFVKFANRGWMVQPGYENPPFFAFLRLQAGSGQFIGFPVWDVGPWNEDDDYWHDGGRRRMFGDLPRGLPEAEAAFFDGYNGGKDQFGRPILNPAGVDLTPEAAARLGLDPLENAWVELDMGELS